MTTFLFSLILTSWFKVAETGLTINGTLDSTTVIKKPYISTYYYFLKSVDNKSIVIRQFQPTTDFEVGLFGNCHLEVGSQYQISLHAVKSNTPETSNNIYSKVMYCSKLKFGDSAFESALNKFLSSKKILEEVCKTKEVRLLIC